MKPSEQERLKSIEYIKHIDRIIQTEFVKSFNHSCFSDEQLNDMEKEIIYLSKEQTD